MALASIDLSAAFDIIDVDLLIKRLVILGLPNDVVNLIEIWLRERYFSKLKKKHMTACRLASQCTQTIQSVSHLSTSQ